jgi:N-acetylmuramoyl-L-alanine amidase
VYSYQAGSPAELHDNSEPRPLLVLWNKVYEVHLDQSRQLARVLQQKFAALPGLTTDEPQEAPVRGLRSVDAPAVAIEIGTLTPEADAGTLTDPSFQQQIANVAAAALDTWRGGTL